MKFIVVTWANSEEIRWFRDSKDGKKGLKDLFKSLIEMGIPYDLKTEEFNVPHLQHAKHEEINHYFESLVKIKRLNVCEVKYLTYKEIGFTEEMGQQMLDAGILGSQANISLVTLEQIGQNADFETLPKIDEVIYNNLASQFGVYILINVA